MTKAYVSLGFACESKNAIQRISAPCKGLPFDWNITRKQQLLAALKTNGACFRFNADQCSIYKYIAQGSEGVEANGIFFWHANLQDSRHKVIDNWRDCIDILSETYVRRWKRFAGICRDGQIKKHFILSNAQSNLPHFLGEGETFADAYGIDGVFLDQLVGALNEFGVRDFHINLLLRNINDYLGLRPFLECHSNQFTAQFTGEITYPTNDLLIKELGYKLFEAEYSAQKIIDICGVYHGGMVIKATSEQEAVIISGDKFIGVIRPFPGGYLFVFDVSPDFVISASFDGRMLIFSSGANWTKA